MGRRISPRSHQTWGELFLHFEGLNENRIKDYRRELDLDRAIATTRFTHKGVTFEREVFASAIDDCLIVRQTASKPGALNLKVELSRPRDFTTEAVGSNSLRMHGQAQHKGKHLGVK